MDPCPTPARPFRIVFPHDEMGVEHLSTIFGRPDLILAPCDAPDDYRNTK
jgi:hypothetical protein